MSGFMSEVPFKVEECIEDGLWIGFGIIVVEICTLTETVLYVPFPTLSHSVRYLVWKDGIDFKYRRVVVLDEEGIIGAKVWSRSLEW